LEPAAAFTVTVLIRSLAIVVGTFRSASWSAVRLTYPACPVSKTNAFKPPFGWTLDDFSTQRNN
jgi:hypothetical protein